MNISIKQEEPCYTEISNVFIDKYIKGASYAYTVVYIVLLRLSCAGEPGGIERIREMTGLLDSDIVNAFRYWAKEGIIDLTENDEGAEIKIIDLTQKELNKKANEEKAVKETTKKKKGITVKKKENYSVKQIDAIKAKNKEIKLIFEKAQEHYAKLLTYDEMNALIWIVDELQMPMEVIEKLIFFCSQKANSYRYLEKVALTWTEKGINTAEKADEFIELYSNEYKVIAGFLGCSDIKVIECYEDIMEKWLKVYKMPIEILKIACDRTIKNIGNKGPKSVFSYTDRIITTWFEAGVKNEEDIKKLDEKHTQEKDKPQASQTGDNTTKSAKASAGRFVNFAQRSVDADILKEIEKGIKQDELKGLEEIK